MSENLKESDLLLSEGGFPSFYRLLKKFRLSIFLIWSSLVVCGIVVSLVVERRYESVVTMVAADKRSVSPGVGQLGSLASLAGLSIGASSIQEPIALLRSRRLARKFIEHNSLLPILFHDKWDSSQQRWFTNLNRDEIPTLEDGVTFFTDSIRSVSEDRRTGVVSLYIYWNDPELSAKWANQYVALLNSTMRDSAVSDLRANISFLQGELRKSEYVSLQQSIGRVLETELQKLTVASGANEYAMKIVDFGSVARRPVSPNLPLLLIVFNIFGLVFAVAQAYLRDKISSYKW